MLFLVDPPLGPRALRRAMRKGRAGSDLLLVLLWHTNVNACCISYILPCPRGVSADGERGARGPHCPLLIKVGFVHEHFEHEHIHERRGEVDGMQQASIVLAMLHHTI